MGMSLPRCLGQGFPVFPGAMEGHLGPAFLGELHIDSCIGQIDQISVNIMAQAGHIGAREIGQHLRIEFASLLTIQESCRTGGMHTYQDMSSSHVIGCRDGYSLSPDLLETMVLFGVPTLPMPHPISASNTKMLISR